MPRYRTVLVMIFLFKLLKERDVQLEKVVMQKYFMENIQDS